MKKEEFMNEMLLRSCSCDGVWDSDLRTFQHTNYRSTYKGMMTTNHAMYAESDQEFLLQLLQGNGAGAAA